ncbi:methyl-accepting chemotaxis protein [Entomospira entomophila]|uniref:Methyl-accepting chemotaxis protein n=1 Tax=Entomospira entomophila TaxID=2719988 RepID=A0A968KTF6_9SPIO|nr:methyl-accepting chemotaxis protein [Entomospira entomophilus]NIZ40261.1 methyl-accepting chemotaxis protein [Entomospira entomophilus]WDI35820.1 methyl-accepting chemotaxis protein [Entomospira entomophilus]
MKVRTRAAVFISITLMFSITVLTVVTLKSVERMVLIRSIDMGDQYVSMVTAALAEQWVTIDVETHTLQTMMAAHPNNPEERRGWMASLLERMSLGLDNVYGIWVILQPNTLDGLDASFINDPENFGDEFGRVQMYAKKGEVTFLGAHHADIDQTEAISQAIRMRESQVTSPIFSNFNPRVNIARSGYALVQPIINPITNQVHGVVGFDVSSDFLFYPLSRFPAPMPAFLRAVGGLYGDMKIYYHTNPELIGSPASNVFLDGELRVITDTLSNARGDESFHLRRMSPNSDGSFIPVYTFYSRIPLPSKDHSRDWVGYYTVVEEDMLEGIADLRSGVMTGVFFLLILVILIVMILMTVILNTLGKTNEAISDVAAGGGDLTKRIEVRGNDELAELAGNFNKFSDTLQKIVATVKTNTEGLEKTSHKLNSEMGKAQDDLSEIRSTVDVLVLSVESQMRSLDNSNNAVNSLVSSIGSLDDLVVTQAAGITQSSAAIEEMVSSINSVTRIVNDMAQQYKGLYSAGEVGKEKQQLVRDRIREVVKGSVKLQEANSIIEEIANQTNLLAMNAAIEAAHAGDIGKGFAVVADEIRNLAESAAEQSKSIGQELRTVHETIASIEQASNDSEHSYSDVFNAIDSLSNLVDQVQSAMQEQSVGSGEVLRSLKMITQSSQDVKDAAMTMRDESVAIIEVMKNLTEGMVSDRKKVGSVASVTEGIMETTSQLSRLVRDNESKIGEVAELMAQFKV